MECGPIPHSSSILPLTPNFSLSQYDALNSDMYKDILKSTPFLPPGAACKLGLVTRKAVLPNAAFLPTLSCGT